jgi:hypothetical protein
MNKPKRRICKLDILTPVNGSMETSVALAPTSATVLSTMHTIIRNRADTKKGLYTMWHVLWSKEQPEMMTI